MVEILVDVANQFHLIALLSGSGKMHEAAAEVTQLIQRFLKTEDTSERDRDAIIGLVSFYMDRHDAIEGYAALIHFALSRIAYPQSDEQQANIRRLVAALIDIAAADAATRKSDPSNAPQESGESRRTE